MHFARIYNLEASFNEFCNMPSNSEQLLYTDEVTLKLAENERKGYEDDFFDAAAKAKDLIAISG